MSGHVNMQFRLSESIERFKREMERLGIPVEVDASPRHLVIGFSVEALGEALANAVRNSVPANVRQYIRVRWAIRDGVLVVKAEVVA